MWQWSGQAANIFTIIILNTTMIKDHKVLIDNNIQTILLKSPAVMR